MEKIIEIATKIKKAGGTLYLVGGALRDELLDKKSHDKDYSVIGLAKEEFKKLFPEAKLRGKAFEVFELEGNEFALARKEQKQGTGHKNFNIQTGKEITIEEDLARRDITINAIAKEVLTNQIIDPFHGQEDLKNKKIRATTKAFAEDPLRVYRVARFASILDFEVTQETLQMMGKLKQELTTLSKERIFWEFEKALIANKPSIFFEVLKEAKVLEVHFKEIADLIGSLQPIEYHPEGDSYTHTMIVLDKAAELTKDPMLRFCALVHDLGKGITPKEMYPHHYGHDEKGVILVENLGKRIGTPHLWIECGKVACKEHMKGGIFERMTIPKKVGFIERVAKTKLGLEGLQIVVIADKCSTRNTNLKTIDFQSIGQRCLTEVNGNTLHEKGIKEEGLQFKEKLHQERIHWYKENIEKSY